MVSPCHSLAAEANLGTLVPETRLIVHTNAI